MAATRFSDSATPTFDLSKSRPKYTTTSGFCKPTSGLTTTTFYTRFSNYGHYTTFRTISGTFESTSGSRISLHRFRFGAPVFLIESISSRLYAIRRQYKPKIRQKIGVLGALEAKPEVEIWRRPLFLTQRPRIPI